MLTKVRNAIFNTRQRLVEGDYAYHFSSAETADNFYELATDTYVVNERKIIAQSFTADITPKKEQASESDDRYKTADDLLIWNL
jgi:hypothetical protein